MITVPDPNAPVEGILDRFRNGRELLKILNSGLVSEVLDIISLVPAGKYGEALVDVGDILVIEGLIREGEAVRDLGNVLIPRPINRDNLIDSSADLLKILLNRFLPTIPVMTARKSIKDMTRVEAQKWLSDNVANLRDGRDRPSIRRALRNAPEVLDALDGKPQTVSMTPERAEQVIKILDWAIFISTVAGMFFPGALAVSTALRAIQVMLKSKFPEVNALEDFTPDGTERGLDLSDFGILA
jgi:hypothetical protein